MEDACPGLGERIIWVENIVFPFQKLCESVPRKDGASPSLGFLKPNATPQEVLRMECHTITWPADNQQTIFLHVLLSLAPYNDESSQLSDTIYGVYPYLKKWNSWGWRKSSVVKIIYCLERILGSVPSTNMLQLQLQDHPNPSSDFLGHLHSCIHILLLPWCLCIILIEEMEFSIAGHSMWRRMEQEKLKAAVLGREAWQ